MEVQVWKDTRDFHTTPPYLATLVRTMFLLLFLREGDNLLSVIIFPVVPSSASIDCESLMELAPYTEDEEEEEASSTFSKPLQYQQELLPAPFYRCTHKIYKQVIRSLL